MFSLLFSEMYLQAGYFVLFHLFSAMYDLWAVVVCCENSPVVIENAGSHSNMLVGCVHDMNIFYTLMQQSTSRIHGVRSLIFGTSIMFALLVEKNYRTYESFIHSLCVLALGTVLALNGTKPFIQLETMIELAFVTWTLLVHYICTLFLYLYLFFYEPSFSSKYIDKIPSK